MPIDPTPYESRTDLALASSGITLDVWDEYEVALSMLDAGNPWSFTFWRSDPVDGDTAARTTTWDVIARQVKVFDHIMVNIDGAAQLNGRIEVRDIGADRSGATVTISGRDMAGPAMDWDVAPTLTIKNTPLSSAVPRAFAQLGITARVVDSAANVQVTAREAPGPRRTNTRARRPQVVDIAHPRPGERVWPFVEGIVQRIGYRMWVAPDAERGIAVVVDTPNDNATPSYVLFRREIANGRGAYEGNILAGREKVNGRGAPTEVTVYSGTARGSQVSARTMVTTANAAILDLETTRGLTMQPPPTQPRYSRSTRARTPERASQDGANIILEAMAGFRVYECTVRGHGQTVDSARRLYALNTVARVRDDVCPDSQGRPLDEDMLITGIRFRRSRQNGTTTTLTLVPRGALALTPTET